MKIIAVKTHPVRPNENLFDLIDTYVSSLSENSILVVTSKIVALCQGRVYKTSEIEKDELIKKEADYYLPRSMSRYNFFLTIKNSVLLPSAGIDESNAGNYFVLWPENPQKAANSIRSHIKKKFHLKNIGVLITDSKTTPLRWGTTGIGVAHSGFKALKNYIGTPDLFGREMQVTQSSIIDGLSASSVVVMGEGSESTPFAVVSDIPFVQFQNRNPTKKELDSLKIDIEDDLYAPLLQSVRWEKSTKNK